MSSLKRWNGASWVLEPIKTYLAGSWQRKPLKRWTGSVWETVTVEVPSGTAPYITSLSVSVAYPSDTVTITGTNFGATRGTSTVYFGAHAAIVLSWAATSIAVTVPTFASGSEPITVTTSAGTSNAAPFTVTAISTFQPETYDASAGVDGHDCHDAIQSAYTAAHNAGRGIVFFTSGRTYYVAGTPIQMQAIRTNDWLDQATLAPRAGSTVVRSGTIIISGYGATIKFSSASTERYGFLFNGYQGTTITNTFGNVLVEGLTFDDNGRLPAGECGSMMWIRDSCNVDKVTFRDCSLSGSAPRVTWAQPRNLAGVYFRNGNSTTQTNWNYGCNIFIDGCSIYSQQKAVAFLGGTTVSSLGNPLTTHYDNLWLRNSTFSPQGYYGTAVHAGGAATVGTILFEGCTFTDSGDNLVEISQGMTITFTDCNFSKSHSGFGYSRFAYFQAGTPQVTMTRCHYTGGAAAIGWKATYDTYQGKLIDLYNPYSDTRTFGHITLQDCSVTQDDYQYRQDCEFNAYATYSSLTIDNYTYTDHHADATGDLLYIRPRSSCPITMSDCTFDVSGTASSLDLIQIANSATIDFDDFTCTDNIPGNYINLAGGTINGDINQITSGSTTTVNAPRAVNRTGGTGTVTVHDCDFSAMKTGTVPLLGTGVTGTNNTTPAG